MDHGGQLYALVHSNRPPPKSGNRSCYRERAALSHPNVDSLNCPHTDNSGLEVCKRIRGDFEDTPFANKGTSQKTENKAR